MPKAKGAKLSSKLFDKDIPKEPNRVGFGEGLVLAGDANKNVVALCADLAESTKMSDFKAKYPDRFIEVGVAEQNLATVAAGLSLVGKVPYITSYAGFSPGRNWEQIRTTIALAETNVKIVGSHAGVSVGPDGATHQMLEDLAIMRAMPKMIVIAPCDQIEARKATFAVSQMEGAVYMRFAREKTAIFTTDTTPFEIGKGQLFWEGSDVSIIACGPLVYQALLAAKELEKKKITADVINMPTIKPLDTEIIRKSVAKTKAAVTVEEAQITGGLGGAVCEWLSENMPTPVVRVGMKDRFGESGDSDFLVRHFGMDSEGIIKAVETVLKKKGK